MKFIIDKRLPNEIKDKISLFGDIIEFSTENIVYNSISGHPDIFLCYENNKFIYAPNIPSEYSEKLSKENILLIKGKNNVGYTYPHTSLYNCVITKEFIIHNLKFTDKSVFEIFNDKETINVRQGYTRCNLVPLNDYNFITSDLDVLKRLNNKGFNVFYFPPENIILNGFKNGFIGGCCGFYENILFMTGKLNKYNFGNELKDFLRKIKVDLVELYDGFLIDGGSLIIF